MQLLALREAVLAFSADLSLSETLKRIVVAAAQLVNARYAALGVPDDSGETLIEFITTGLTPEQEAQISRRPRGHGILGLILREGKSLRLTQLSEHPRAVGFPANHPPMTSFLGVPITQRGKQIGDLYLTDKIDADEFTEADQAVIELLASHASIALQNARLFQAAVARSRELQERNRELAALNVVAQAVSEHLDLNRVMAEALDQVLAVTEAEVGEIFLLDENNDELALALHHGPFADEFQTIRRFKKGQGFPGQVATLGKPLLSTDLARDMRYLRREVIDAGFKSYVSIPLLSKGKVVGTLDLASRRVDVFDVAGLTLLEAIGHQIGIAVENARLHKQVTQLAVLEERQRIGMDLHDGIIQSIYAVGLTLDYVQAQLADSDMGGASDRLTQAAEALNTTIRDIRAYILDLRPRRFEGDNLIAGLKQLIVEFKANTLMSVEFSADTAADASLTPEARLALFHIAQEALSNAAKHSRASRLDVRFAIEDGNTVLSLRDNGQGFQTDRIERRVGHGLMNMHDRAVAIGGSFSAGSNRDNGTEVRVTLPRRTDFS
ncbi:MAG TPA: GAF domain-containing sensor histidine kinase [Anaerolineales bacterium]|nr:GAF domain-containing sensor histidine kinase [Anaerolineales bacterium]